MAVEKFIDIEMQLSDKKVKVVCKYVLDKILRDSGEEGKNPEVRNMLQHLVAISSVSRYDEKFKQLKIREGAFYATVVGDLTHLNSIYNGIITE